jgi:hypothetical protein
MCAGSDVSSATSSRRSAGDRPAAGSSNRISRGAPASAMPISSWRCCPCARLATTSPAMCVSRARSSSSSVARWLACDGTRAAAAEAPVAHAAHRQEQVVAHRQLAEQQRRLVGAPQPLADALVRRQFGDVFAEEADAPAGGREVTRDGVEQRGLARAVGLPSTAYFCPAATAERHVVHRTSSAPKTCAAPRVVGGEHRGRSSVVGRCQTGDECTPPAVGCGWAVRWRNWADRSHGEVLDGVKGNWVRRATRS